MYKDTMTRGEWILYFDILSMLFYCIAYIDCIRIGVKHKTYCVPFFAICMNICWESWAIVDFAIHGETELWYYVVDTSWVMLDVFVVYTYIKYGRLELSRMKSLLKCSKISSIDVNLLFKLRIVIEPIFVVITLIICYIYFNLWKVYFAFVDNLIYSALYIIMLYIRRGSRGQSMSIAICKGIGTFAATINTGFITHYMPICIIGMLCFLFDIIYIILLNRTIQAEKAVALSPKNKKKQNAS